MYRIVETGAFPKFYLWRRRLLWWSYVFASDDIGALKALVPAHRHIQMCVCGTKY